VAHSFVDDDSQAIPEPMLFRVDSTGTSLGLYLTANAGSKIAGLLRGIVLAWLMTQAQFGLFQLSLMVTSVLYPLCSFGLPEALLRYVPHHQARHRLRWFLLRAIPVAVVLTFILCAIAYALAAPIGRILFETLGATAKQSQPIRSTQLTQHVMVLVFTLACYMLVLHVLKGLRMFRAVSAVELLHHLGFAVVALVVAASGWNRASSILLIYAGALVVSMMVVLPQILRQLKKPPQKVAVDSQPPSFQLSAGRLLRFGVGASIAAVLWHTLQYYPMWHLHKAAGREGEVTAIFGAVRLIAQAALLGTVAVVSVVQASLTRTWETTGPEAARKDYRLAIKLNALLLLVGCSILAVTSSIWMRIFPDNYSIGIEIVPLQLLFFMLSAHLVFLAIFFHLIEQPRLLFLPWFVGLAAIVLISVRWPMELDNAEAALTQATWMAVAGITASLIVCAAVMWWRQATMGLRVWLLLLASYILVCPAPVIVGLLLLLLAAAALTPWILDHDERQRIGRIVHQWRSR
jgi:O-antigen/teichoic acid export membrane protein